MNDYISYRGCLFGVILGIVLWSVIGLGIYAYCHYKVSAPTEFCPKHDCPNKIVIQQRINLCLTCHQP